MAKIRRPLITLIVYNIYYSLCYNFSLPNRFRIISPQNSSKSFKTNFAHSGIIEKCSMRTCSSPSVDRIGKKGRKETALLFPLSFHLSWKLLSHQFQR